MTEVRVIIMQESSNDSSSRLAYKQAARLLLAHIYQSHPESRRESLTEAVAVMYVLMCMLSIIQTSQS